MSPWTKFEIEYENTTGLGIADPENYKVKVDGEKKPDKRISMAGQPQITIEIEQLNPT